MRGKLARAFRHFALSRYETMSKADRDVGLRRIYRAVKTQYKESKKEGK